MTESKHTPDADILASAIASAISKHWDGQLRAKDCRAAAEAVMEAIGAPEMLAELRRLHALYGHQQTANVIAKATGALTSGNRTDD